MHQTYEKNIGHLVPFTWTCTLVPCHPGEYKIFYYGLGHWNQENSPKENVCQCTQNPWIDIRHQLWVDLLVIADKLYLDWCGHFRISHCCRGTKDHVVHEICVLGSYQKGNQTALVTDQTKPEIAQHTGWKLFKSSPVKYLSRCYHSSICLCLPLLSMPCIEWDILLFFAEPQYQRTELGHRTHSLGARHQKDSFGNTTPIFRPDQGVHRSKTTSQFNLWELYSQQKSGVVAILFSTMSAAIHYCSGSKDTTSVH